MNRRNILIAAGPALLAAMGLSALGRRGANAADAPSAQFTVVHTDAEWRKRLSPEQYEVLRRQGTEAPESSPLDHEVSSGRYDCAGCALPLFTSATKFDSGTGWPSFYQPIEGAVDTSSDSSLLMERTEVHCHRCGSHLGHVFNDGPKPTGLRYCMNGVALVFHKTGEKTT